MGIFFSHGSGGQTAATEVWTSMVLTGGSEEESVPRLSPGFWWLLAILDCITSIFASSITWSSP